MAGRPSGRPLTDLKLRHLRFLIEIRELADSGGRIYKERIEDFVLECLDDGASTQGMASQLGVGKSTVQTWKKNAERRRSG